MGVVAAVIGAAVIGGASAAHSASQQRSAAKADSERRTNEAAAAKAEADRIALETKPEEESLSETQFGIGDEDNIGGSTQEFVIPKTSALGSSSTGRSGLGFRV